MASATQVQLEAQELALRRRIPYLAGETNMRYLLNIRERQALSDYNKAYFHKYGMDPCEQEGLFYFLGDNPSYSLTWSAAGRLPTFRMNRGLLWSAKFNRWLTSKERLVSMGWPVTPEMALAMAVPQVPALDIKRASDILEKLDALPEHGGATTHCSQLLWPSVC